ncbi:hypothetical protein K525DRAFT_187185 [Schizophyllum commune Loenen D]|nr:hypothetical protein K525DRAFT_187185 [Schizophyllum commune Loenen D]
MFYAALAFSILFSTTHLPTARARPRSFAFNFTTVRECEPVSLTFPDVTSDDIGIPTYLTIVPVNATPATIPLPDVADNFLAGINITFIPVPEGTQFIASLDDADGNAVAYVTELLTVEPSDISDGSCLPLASASFYTFNTAITQCTSYGVEYNASTDAPTVRAFSLGQTAYTLNETDASNGEATYTAAVAYGSQVILMANNTIGQAQASQLLTVLGDGTTDASCLPNDTDDMEDEPEESTDTQPTLSHAAIIGLAVGGCIIGLVAALMVLYFCRERRKRTDQGPARRRALSVLDASGFYERPNPSLVNSSTANLMRNMSQRDLGNVATMSATRPSFMQGTPSPDTAPRESYIPYVPPPIPAEAPRTPLTPPSSSSQPASPSPMRVYPVKHNSEFLTGSEAFVMNPSYAFGSPPASPGRQSFAKERAMPSAVPPSPLATSMRRAPSPQPSIPHRNSMQSLDIETMLNMASPPEDNPLHGSDGSHDYTVAVDPSTPPGNTSAPSPTQGSPTQVISSPPRRGHFRPPSDVPRDPYASGLSAFDFANLSRPPSFASLASRRLQQHERNGSVVSRGDSDVQDASMLGVPRAF